VQILVSNYAPTTDSKNNLKRIINLTIVIEINYTNSISLLSKFSMLLIKVNYDSFTTINLIDYHN